MPLGHPEPLPHRPKPTVDIYGKKVETESLWSVLAKQLDTTPSKFTEFINLIKQASNLNSVMIEEQKKKMLSDFLENKNVQRSKH